MKKLFYICTILLFGCEVNENIIVKEESAINTEHSARQTKPNEVVVRFKNGLSESQKESIRAFYGIYDNYKTCSCGDKNLESWQFSPEIPLIDLEERVRGMKAENDMEGADFNFNIQLSGLDFNENSGVPTDTSINATPRGTQFNIAKSKRVLSGDGVVIGVIDSGIDASNPQFTQNFLYNSTFDNVNCSDVNGNLDAYGWNFTEDTNNPYDTVGHGTKTSFYIYNQAVANGISNFKILPAKAFDDNGGNLFNASCAFSYLLKKNANIINMSFGFKEESTVYESYIKDAESGNVLIIASAGNTGDNNDISIHNPSNFTTQYPHLLSVAVVNNQFNTVNSISNTGKNSVDIAVNAVDILYTDASGEHHITGSSYSAALASGCATVLLSNGVSPVNLRAAIISNVIQNQNLDDEVKESGYLDLVVY